MNNMNQVNNDSSILTVETNTSIDQIMRQELESVQRRIADAVGELKTLDMRRAELEQWLRDLAVTERTLARMLDVDLPTSTVSGPSENSRRKKPDSIPSVYDMAATVLRNRSDEFVDGQEIVSAIKARWWPSVTANDILPTLWRLATKDQRLRKEGRRYGLPIREGIKLPA
jgi:hypothetical protein